MKIITVEAATLDEALTKGSQQLNIPKEQLVYMVKSPQKSIFSMFQKSKVVVEIEAAPKDVSVQDAIRQYLSDMLTTMGINFTIDIREDNGAVYIHIKSEDGGALIGKNGQTLEALTHVCKQYLTYKVSNKAKIFININDYQEKKEKILADTIRKAVEEVKSTNKPYTFQNMESNDRKFIHQEVQKYTGVISKSEGKNNKRWVVIYPKNSV